MCMMDWRIGRLIKSVRRTFTSPTLAANAVKASQQRVKLQIIMNDPGTLVTDSLAPDIGYYTIAAGGSIVYVANVFTPIYSVSVLKDGDVPTLAHVITDQSFAAPVTIQEWFLPEEVLSEALENFKREYGKWR